MKRQISFIELIVIIVFIAVLISGINIMKNRKKNIPATKNCMMKKITDAEIYGNTPEEKYGNDILLAYMFTSFELLTVGGAIRETPNDLTKIKKLCTVSDKNLDDIKTVVDSLIVPNGYETSKESFMVFFNKIQKEIKTISEAKDEKQLKEANKTKTGGVIPLGNEISKNLEKSGYKPSEDFSKYFSKIFNENISNIKNTLNLK
jgi:hypothetical protein